MSDRTAEFCLWCSEWQGRLRLTVPYVLPAPPFAFGGEHRAIRTSSQIHFTESDAKKGSNCSIPLPSSLQPEKFPFLLCAARCAEEQLFIYRHLHPAWSVNADANKSSLIAAGDVSHLLKNVRMQEKHLHNLELLLQRKKDLEFLESGRLEWETVFSSILSKSVQSLRISRSLNARASRSPDAYSAAFAHRHAILGSLYASLKDLTAELKVKEIAILRGQLASRRFFSAYGVHAESPRRKESTSCTGATVRQQVEASRAAAAAARAAEQLLVVRGRIRKKRAINADEFEWRKGADSPFPENSTVYATSSSSNREVRKRWTRTVLKDDITTVEHSSAADVQRTHQLLEREEQRLVEIFSSESNLVEGVQQKLQEIVQCMDIFSAKVLEQSEACANIKEFAENAVENVTGAEHHLGISIKKTATYRYYVMMFFIIAGVILLFLDFLKSSSPYL